MAHLDDELFEKSNELNETIDEAPVSYKKLSKDDFVLVDNSEYSHDQKFETKPTTFFKDSLKRFSKNKSSVVAAWILGLLIVLSFVIPLVDNNSIKGSLPDRLYLEPKLFDSGTGFWDGCRNYSYIAYDEVNRCPNPADFNPNAVKNLRVDNEFSYTNSYSPLAQGGYINFSCYIDDLSDSVTLENAKFGTTIDLNHSFTATITMADEDVEFYTRAPYSIYVYYKNGSEAEDRVVLVENSTTYVLNEQMFDIREKLLEKNPNLLTYENVYLSFELDHSDKDIQPSILIESVIFNTDASGTEALDEYAQIVRTPNFSGGNEMVGRPNIISNKSNPAYWRCTGNKFLYHAKILFCSFTYDTYLAAFGEINKSIDDKTMKYYVKRKWCTYDFSVGVSSFNILNKKKCPIVEVIEQTESTGYIVTYTLKCKIIYYKFIGKTSMPRYIMGTDNQGFDMLKYVFEGLRTSLILGLVTSTVCFIFGLIWGSISGYFGGAVDLAMERFTDILGGVPWIVVMTLCIVHLGQNFLTFALALCMTGWIGTASRTRTQFYRFKGREYVLASRTLGASNLRLIFKHILPNAMGTIITSAVLMIPSVIFSEATIAYLNLGLRGMSSLGVILSDNQGELLQHSYLLIFPSVIIALLMITFNLFGNGLRDAINPSLKGEDE